MRPHKWEVIEALINACILHLSNRQQNIDNVILTGHIMNAVCIFQMKQKWASQMSDGATDPCHNHFF